LFFSGATFGRNEITCYNKKWWRGRTLETWLIT
jgi:hypothetical protein